MPLMCRLLIRQILKIHMEFGLLQAAHERKMWLQLENTRRMLPQHPGDDWKDVQHPSIFPKRVPARKKKGSQKMNVCWGEQSRQ